MVDAAAAVARMLAPWNLTAEEEAALLSRETCPDAHAQRLRQLREIVGGLYLLFPENPEIRYTWVRRSNAALGGRSPLEVMLATDHGLHDIGRFVWAQLQQ